MGFSSKKFYYLYWRNIAKVSKLAFSTQRLSLNYTHNAISWNIYTVGEPVVFHRVVSFLLAIVSSQLLIPSWQNGLKLETFCTLHLAIWPVSSWLLIFWLGFLHSSPGHSGLTCGPVPLSVALISLLEWEDFHSDGLRSSLLWAQPSSKKPLICTAMH